MSAGSFFVVRHIEQHRLQKYLKETENNLVVYLIYHLSIRRRPIMLEESQMQEIQDL